MKATYMSQNPTVQKLFGLNKDNSQAYVDAEISRQMHRNKYPISLGVSKCMDGRVHLPVMTNTPLGYMHPWRNIGGNFDLGWPFYQETIAHWLKQSIRESTPMVMLTTYHYARGAAGEDVEKVKSRGCAGHEYDTEAAHAASWKLKQQFDDAFRNDDFYALNWGVETDLDALILNGEKGQIVDLSEFKYHQVVEIVDMLRELHPQVPIDVIRNLVPVIEGNIAHITGVRNSNRPIIDMEHKERVLAVGRGFDWLHEPNLALIVGPYDPQLEAVIGKAAGLLQGNLENNRVKPEDGLVLLVSAQYEEDGYKRRLAEFKAQNLAKVSQKAIEKYTPNLELDLVMATCDMKTRKLNVLN